MNVSFRHHLRVGRTDFSQALRYERSSMQSQIQLYYSSSSMVADLDLEPQGCDENHINQPMILVFVFV